MNTPTQQKLRLREPSKGIKFIPHDSGFTVTLNGIETGYTMEYDLSHSSRKFYSIMFNNMCYGVGTLSVCKRAIAYMLCNSPLNNQAGDVH